jgi:hypothetical protein
MDGLLQSCGSVEQTRQLVHLQEGPVGLWYAYSQPLAASGVAVDIAVLDGVVEDCGERVD